MFLSTNTSIFSKNRPECFGNSKLQALDQCWTINKSYPMQQQIQKIIENILNARLQKTLRQTGLDLIMNFEWSLSISTTIGRLSANIISFVSCFFISKVKKLIYKYRK